MKSPSGQTIFNSLCAPGSRGNSRTHFPGLLARCPFAFLWSACPFRISLGCLPTPPFAFGLLAGCPLAFLWVACCLPAALSHFSGLLAGCPFAFGLLVGCPFAFHWVACWLPLCIRVACRLAWVACFWSFSGAPFSGLGCCRLVLPIGCPFACLCVACRLPLRISLGCPLCISLGCLLATSFAFLGVACRLPLRISLSCLPAAPSHLSGLLAGCPIAFLWVACR